MTLASDQELFDRLRREIERELTEYRYEVSTGSVGIPWSNEKVAQELHEMTRHLVEPRWEEVEIAHDHREAMSGEYNVRRCVLLAEDNDYVLVFDPAEDLYHLGCRVERGIATWGINGNAVDCFLAR